MLRTLLTSAFCFACLSLAQAELPPSAYKKLKADAEEVLEIKVKEVFDSNKADRIRAYVMIKAEITGVERSKMKYKVGDKIEIESYYRRPDAPAGFVGPSFPPKVTVGSSWQVYLNHSDKKLVPAAHGQSFAAK